MSFLKKFFYTIFLLLWFSPICVYATNNEESLPSLHAKSVVLMDGDTGRVLYGKEEETILPNASTTKILTCILALEHANLDDTVEVSKEAASMPDVQLNIVSGEHYRLEDLLYSLMLESHNDSAVAIAQYIEKKTGISSFSDLMNEKAKSIGCTNTHFVTPNGLDGDSYVKGKGAHETTAKDLALIMRYCVTQSEKKDEFLTITRTASHSFTDIEKKRSFTVNNHNAYLSMDEDALSGKTGFTNKAGFCYVGAVKKGEKTLIVSLLACGWPPHKTYKWMDMKALIQYGNEHYEMKEFTAPKENLPNLFIKNGKEQSVSLHVVNVPIRVLAKSEENLTFTWQLTNQTAPIQKGQQVGWMRYYLGDYRLAEAPIVTDTSILQRKGWFGRE